MYELKYRRTCIRDNLQHTQNGMVLSEKNEKIIKIENWKGVQEHTTNSKVINVK